MIFVSSLHRFVSPFPCGHRRSQRLNHRHLEAKEENCSCQMEPATEQPIERGNTLLRVVCTSMALTTVGNKDQHRHQVSDEPPSILSPWAMEQSSTHPSHGKKPSPALSGRSNASPCFPAKRTHYIYIYITYVINVNSKQDYREKNTHASMQMHRSNRHQKASCLDVHRSTNGASRSRTSSPASESTWEASWTHPAETI